MDFSKFYKVYFIGAGGIGMSALARYFKKNGMQVAGYDRTPTLLTHELKNEGIQIHYDDNIEMIPSEFKQNEDTLIVYTPAIPHNHKELTYYRENDFTLLKRSQVLGEITRSKRCIAVAGTHGKTTISSMIAHLMSYSEYKCTAFLGGIVKNLKSNFMYSESSDFMVVEADEFDRSFLSLNPSIAVIGSLDADHLDIYGNRNTMLDTYIQFISQIDKENGILIYKKELERVLRIPDYLQSFSYSLNEDSDFRIHTLNLSNYRYTFTVKTNERDFRVTLGMPGLVNVENAVAAIAATYASGVRKPEVYQKLASFQGIRRRFDIQMLDEKIIYIDDYAHHPRELEAFIQSVKAFFPEKKLCGIFQPHLYSRTLDFVDGFAKSLDLLDEVILIPIYPAREEPIPGISSE
ncbi:UDP-N-acetylmuramate--L-alanine ligase, partial [Bacteroidota bacterium]